MWNKKIKSHDAGWETQRKKMVDDQLRTRGITNQAVLHAMKSVPREFFVPEQERASAYADCALPLSHGQTISQPFTVAFMCEALEPSKMDTVLEIGTGSGYGAAVLSELFRFVHTIEFIPELAEAARCRLADIGCENVQVHAGDGSAGLATEAPFDAIVATAVADDVPPPFRDQLADGGRVVIPLKTSNENQAMFRMRRMTDEYTIENLGAFSFVPMVGKFGTKSRH